MIKYEGGDECDLFGFDFEAEDERSWGVVRGRRIFLALQTLPHILFELQLSSTRAVCFVPKNMHGAGYVSNWTVSPMT